MKRSFKLIKPIFFGILSVALLSSCSEDESISNGPSSVSPQQTVINDKNVKNEMDALVENLPGFAVYNETMDKYILFNPFDKDKSKDFSFSDPNPGWNFATSDGVEYVAGPDGENFVVVSPGSFGGSTGAGGTVVAGNSVLNISIAMCFSASDEAMGLDLIDIGANFDGISAVVGIDGDFEALASGEFDEEEELDITDFFRGFAYYIVYDNEASGSYDVLDWFNDLNTDEDDLNGNAFAWVLDFTNPGGIYFSNSGSLTVSGGSITFNGTYYAITGSFLETDGEWSEMNYVEVDGYGTMGC